MARAVTRREFERLVREHLPDALRLALRLTNSADLAEDIVQSSMLRASRSWKSFRCDSTFKTWLHRIVVNVHRDYLSSTQRHLHKSLDCVHEVGAEDHLGPSRQAETQELSELVSKLVHELPARQREAIVLFSYEQNTISEIAAILDITEANVYATLHIARRRLRQALRPYFADPGDSGCNQRTATDLL